MQIKEKVFFRIVIPTFNELGTAIANVTTEVNTFCSAFTNLGDVLDIRHETRAISKYGPLVFYSVTVFM